MQARGEAVGACPQRAGYPSPHRPSPGGQELAASSGCLTLSATAMGYTQIGRCDSMKPVPL